MFNLKKLMIGFTAVAVLGMSVQTNSIEVKAAEDDTTATVSTKETTVNSSTVSVNQQKKIVKPQYTQKELRYMSCIIYAEAGNQPYAGKKAVGIVVKNRMESKKYPNSIKGVLYQRSQFGPARNGSLSRTLKSYDKGKFKSSRHKQCIKAAKTALSGEKVVKHKGKNINMKGFLYFSGKVKGAKVKISGHQFK